MPTRVSPTVRHRRLVAELRRLRDASDLSRDLVADRLDWSPSKVWRIETGRSPVHPGDVRNLLELYGVTGEERDALIQLARQARRRGWWQAYADALPEWFQVYVGLEDEAAAVRTYQNQLLPGILQTEEYATAVFRSYRPTLSADEAERRVAARMARQELLTKPDPLQVWAVLDEAVLRRQVGGAAVMRAQLDRLAELAARPNITIQVLAFKAGSHAAMGSSFVILQFPEPADPDVVYLEDLTSSLYLEETEDVDRYTLVFDHLRTAALTDEESMALIRTVAEEMS